MELIYFASHSAVLKFGVSVLVLTSEDRGMWFSKSCLIFDSVQKEMPNGSETECSSLLEASIHCLLLLYSEMSKSCWTRGLQELGSHHPLPTVITHHVCWHSPPSLTITHHYPAPHPLLSCITNLPPQPAPLIKQALCAVSCAPCPVGWGTLLYSITTAAFDMD